MKFSNKNYKGIRPAAIVEVMEGKGTLESPSEIAYYAIVYEEVGGVARPVTLGKVVLMVVEDGKI